MTNNDDLALKLKAAAEKALPAIEKYEAGEIDGDDALEMLSDFTDVIKPANILALLAERDADKKRIAEQQEHISSLDEGVNMLLAQYDQLASAIGWTTEKALAGEGNQDQYAEAMVKRISELEARTVSVKLRTPGIIKSPIGMHCEVWERAEVESAIAAAGIKLEVGE
jgi:hypothetical protein